MRYLLGIFIGALLIFVPAYLLIFKFKGMMGYGVGIFFALVILAIVAVIAILFPSDPPPPGGSNHGGSGCGSCSSCGGH